MVSPQPAPVRPRVCSADARDSLPLDDEIRSLLEQGETGKVQLIGPAGSGKTTALNHLAAVLPPAAPVVLKDDAGPGHIIPPTGRLLVYTTSKSRESTHLATYRLAPWGRDDLIEYLLATHRDRCRSVMERIRDEDLSLFRGLPDLWRPVLNELADDDTLLDARAALSRHLQRLLGDSSLKLARDLCLDLLAVGADRRGSLQKQIDKLCGRPSERRLLGHDAVVLLLAADGLASVLRGEPGRWCLGQPLRQDLVRLTGLTIRGDTGARERLLLALAGSPRDHAMAASLLHASGTAWQPGPNVRLLNGAHLDGVRWPGLDLTKAELANADLSDADLTRADLTDVAAFRVNLRNALLCGATLRSTVLHEADLSGADLCEARAIGANFILARLERCRLHSASLREADLRKADLTDAILRDADLTKADLTGAKIEGADFSGATLRHCLLSHLRLHEANFTGAEFGGATMTKCDLEYMELPGADFAEAVLTGALLTGTVMPRANFRGADLRNAGLAEVEWEGVCLCGADLTGASFHMGSTRSGLVGSPLACEGSRTGFYTDDFEEQHFKAPEEVRKANLCGADLRGAKLDDVDFYLVDLREAKFDEEVAAHLRRCGAILEART